MEKQEETTENVVTEKVAKAKKTTPMSDVISDVNLVYEVSYLLLPTLTAAQVEEQVSLLKSAVTAAAGTLISDENPVMIDLAYSMTKVVGITRHKCVTGYFGWMKFDMPQGAIVSIKKTFDTNDTVLRSLILKTVRENTLLNGKMMLKKEEKSREDAAPNEDEVVEVAEGVATPEEIDKSIDELVIA